MYIDRRLLWLPWLAAAPWLLVLGTPVAAQQRSSGYLRAVQCSADAVSIARWLESTIDGRRHAAGWRQDASRWLAVAIGKGERTALEATNDRNAIADRLDQGYFATQPGDGRRRAYLERVADRLESCKKHPPG